MLHDISLKGLTEKYNMDVKGVIHIGAHRGRNIIEYIDIGVRDIVVFEPLSDNFNILEQNLSKLNANIIGHQVALGSEEKKAIMYLSSNDTQSSSILKPKVHLTHHPDVSFDDREEVEVKLLDSYNIENCNFIVIDVQGYELEVFKGGKETLEKIDYIYTEINRDELYENCVQMDELDNFLGEYGFKRVWTYWPTSWYQWGDAIYVKN